MSNNLYRNCKNEGDDYLFFIERDQTLTSSFLKQLRNDEPDKILFFRHRSFRASKSHVLNIFFLTFFFLAFFLTLFLFSNQYSF